MTCVPWGGNPGGPLGVLGTNILPLGCKGSPCQTTCADSYVKLIDAASAGVGILLIMGRKSWGGASWLALVLGVGLIAFAFLSLFVLPNITVPWVTGPISVGWY